MLDVSHHTINHRSEERKGTNVMAGSIQGKNLRVGNKSIVLFELKGELRANGKWIVGISFDGTRESGYMDFEVSPDSSLAVKEIEEIIEADIADGREEIIDHVLISNRVAIRLFLQGALLPQSFRNATEDDETITITATFASKPRKVVIRSEFDESLEYAVSTRDVEGKVV
jgi:hypothetical protein